ncbi:MAG: hypothetical protein WBV94_18710 [Blastocatellia bacterium]
MNLSAPLHTITPKKFPTGMVFLFLLLIGFVTTMGIVVPLLSAQDLAHAGFGPGIATLIFVVSALVTLGIDSLLVWLLLKLIHIQQQIPMDVLPQIKSVKQPATKDYSPAQITAPPESIGSVTEHTTRNFEEYENLIRARQSNKDTA